VRFVGFGGGEVCGKYDWHESIGVVLLVSTVNYA